MEKSMRLSETFARGGSVKLLVAFSNSLTAIYASQLILRIAERENFLQIHISLA